jgi:hypothetical protein
MKVIKHTWSFSIVLSGLFGFKRLPNRGAVIFDNITCFSKFFPGTNAFITRQSPETTLYVYRY